MTITPPSSPKATVKGTSVSNAPPSVNRKRPLERNLSVASDPKKKELSIEDVLRKLPIDVASNSSFSGGVNRCYNFLSKSFLGSRSISILNPVSPGVVSLPLGKTLGEGAHTVVTELANPGTQLRDCHFLSQNIQDSDVVIKIPKDGPDVSIQEAMHNSLNQYRNLQERYSHVPPEERPIAEIYNADRAKEQGFYIQERVDLIGVAPWDRSTSIDDLSPQNRRVLGVVTDLFQRSFVEDTGKSKPGVDLWFPNLGLRRGNGAPVLFDYRESDDAFSCNARIHLKDLSNGNREVKAHLIEGLDKKVSDPTRLGLLESYKE